VVPSVLLLVQAGLPFAPRHARQHALPGLARAFVKLSSGVLLLLLLLLLIMMRMRMRMRTRREEGRVPRRSASRILHIMS
jgi:hypothetical protein